MNLLTQMLVKAATHKYFKRKLIGRDPKTGRARYRYYYKEHHGGGITAVEDIKAGEAFKLKDPSTGQQGHFHVKSVDGDKITVEHDESGNTSTMTKNEFQALLKREHGRALEADAKRKQETYERMKRETPKHIGLKAAKRRAQEARARAGISEPIEEGIELRGRHLDTFNKLKLTSERLDSVNLFGEQLTFDRTKLETVQPRESLALRLDNLKDSGVDLDSLSNTFNAGIKKALLDFQPEDEKREELVAKKTAEIRELVALTLSEEFEQTEKRFMTHRESLRREVQGKLYEISKTGELEEFKTLEHPLYANLGDIRGTRFEAELTEILINGGIERDFIKRLPDDLKIRHIVSKASEDGELIFEGSKNNAQMINLALFHKRRELHKLKRGKLPEVLKELILPDEIPSKQRLQVRELETMGLKKRIKPEDKQAINHVIRNLSKSGGVPLEAVRVNYYNDIRANCSTRNAKAGVKEFEELPVFANIALDDKTNDRRTTLHEAAHIFEDLDETIFNIVTCGYVAKIEPSAETLEILPNERVFSINSFNNPYAGKLYGDRASELLSVGVEHFRNDVAIRDFMARDYEHFIITYAIMKGYFHESN